MDNVACPDCSFELELDGSIDLGEIVVCENCGADLIVAAVNPIILEVFEEEEK